jgi:hypothetical protein
MIHYAPGLEVITFLTLAAMMSVDVLYGSRPERSAPASGE